MFNSVWLVTGRTSDFFFMEENLNNLASMTVCLYNFFLHFCWSGVINCVPYYFVFLSSQTGVLPPGFVLPGVLCSGWNLISRTVEISEFQWRFFSFCWETCRIMTFDPNLLDLAVVWDSDSEKWNIPFYERSLDLAADCCCCVAGSSRRCVAAIWSADNEDFHMLTGLRPAICSRRFSSVRQHAIKAASNAVAHLRTCSLAASTSVRVCLTWSSESKQDTSQESWLYTPIS